MFSDSVFGIDGSFTWNLESGQTSHLQICFKIAPAVDLYTAIECSQTVSLVYMAALCGIFDIIFKSALRVHLLLT